MVNFDKRGRELQEATTTLRLKQRPELPGLQEATAPLRHKRGRELLETKTTTTKSRQLKIKKKGDRTKQHSDVNKIEKRNNGNNEAKPERYKWLQTKLSKAMLLESTTTKTDVGSTVFCEE